MNYQQDRHPCSQPRPAGFGPSADFISHHMPPMVNTSSPVVGAVQHQLLGRRYLPWAGCAWVQAMLALPVPCQYPSTTSPCCSSGTTCWHLGPCQTGVHHAEISLHRACSCPCVCNYQGSTLPILISRTGRYVHGPASLAKCDIQTLYFIATHHTWPHLGKLVPFYKLIIN